MKVTLHLGFHKTGTTYVQSIYRQLTGSAAATYIGPDDVSFGALKGLLLKARNGQVVDLATLEDAASTLLTQARSKADFFLSDETLLGATPLSDSVAGVRTLYPRLEQQAQLLWRVFRDFHVRVVITVREPASFIYSLYRDGLRYAKYAYTFEEFLRQIEVRSFDSRILLRRLRAALPVPVDAIHIDERLTPEKLVDAGLISERDLRDPAIHDPVSVNESSPLAIATIQRMFGIYDKTTKGQLRNWLAACPVRLRDKGIAFSDVGRTAAADSYMAAELSAQMLVPRFVHLVWIGEGADPGEVTEPLEVSEQIALWKKTVPDFEVRCWSWQECILLLREEELGSRIVEAIRVCRLAAMRADILRLGLLLIKGGVWSDIKNRPQLNFLETALAGESLVLCEHPPVPTRQDQSGHLCNGFFAAVPRHDFVLEVLELALRSVETRQSGSVYSLTGGGLFNRVARTRMRNGEWSGRVLPFREAWHTWMRRVAMRYNHAGAHWSQRQKTEPLYHDSERVGS